MTTYDKSVPLRGDPAKAIEFAAVTLSTAGFRLDLWDELSVKAEGLLNGEISGLPPVANNVFTSSLIYSF